MTSDENYIGLIWGECREGGGWHVAGRINGEVACRGRVPTLEQAATEAWNSLCRADRQTPAWQVLLEAIRELRDSDHFRTEEATE